MHSGNMTTENHRKGIERTIGMVTSVFIDIVFLSKKNIIFSMAIPNTKSCSISSKMITFFIKALIVDSDVMWITP